MGETEAFEDELEFELWDWGANDAEAECDKGSVAEPPSPLPMPVPCMTPPNDEGGIMRCVSAGGLVDEEFHHHGCDGDDGDFALGGEEEDEENGVDAGT